ncbi:TIGR04206 family protein [Halegenticoccus soli]|uniref:TIGR04206 family protein n=1 Tax=Halegenticoccus soli TaxID=1985678 RepID=UPI000C6DAD70|nr:TIGR04206 family protein [Halegenticoccus soli]
MSATTDSESTAPHSGPAAVLSILALALLPWTVVVENGTTFVMAWGLVTPAPFHAFSIVEYFGQPGVRYGSLPPSLRAWPLASGVYALALASAGVGFATGREDRRVTAGLLVLAGVASLSVTVGFLRRGVPLAVPLGTGALWLTAWWFYRSALRRALPASG